jgi:quercetin dioxygenase-like cupin family protein
MRFQVGKEIPMHRTVVMLTIALVVGIAVGMLGNQILIAQQQPVTRTILQQKDLEGVAGREVIMYRAEAVPGGVAGRHYHPGPELVYVLEGALILEPDGQPPMTLKAGESAHMPAKHIHNAKNASTTEPVKVIVFLVGEKGQPLTTPVQ